MCRMVLHHKDYIARTGEGKLTTAVNNTARENVAALARRLARYYAQVFQFKVKDEEYLFKGESWMDYGLPLDLGPAFKDWDGTPLRPSQTPDPTATIQNLISGVWIPPSQRPTSD